MSATDGTPAEVKVSVAMITYNHERFIAQAIESVLMQETDFPFRLIIGDDCSEDNTQAIIKSYADKYPDRIKTLLYTEHVGLFSKERVGVKIMSLCTAPYVAILDGDDVWLPGKLQAQMDYLRLNPKVGLVATHAQRIDAEGKPMSDKPIYPDQPDGIVSPERIFLDSPLTTSTLLARSECMPWPEPLPAVSRYPDWDFCLKMAARAAVGYIAKIMVLKREHPGNFTVPFQTQEEVDLRLADRLSIIHRNIPLYSGQVNDLDRLRERAEAIEYIRAAIPSYINRAFEPGAQYLANAIARDPTAWQNGGRLADWVTHFAILLAERNGEKECFAFLRDMFAHLPSNLVRQDQFRRAVYGRVHIALGFRYYRQRRFDQVSLHVIRGVLRDPAQLRNRGVVSILARSLIPALRRKQLAL